MRNPCRQRRFLSSKPCMPVRSKTMRNPLAHPQTLAEETEPDNGRTRTVRPCSGQLLHVHEPRTMNSLAADSLLAHPRDGSQRRKPHGLARRLRRKTRQRGGQARAGPAVSPGCAVFAKAGFLCDNKRHPVGNINRPVGAAGAQVPYKHKVTGSNPVPATIETAGQTFSSDLFLFQGNQGLIGQKRV